MRSLPAFTAGFLSASILVAFALAVVVYRPQEAVGGQASSSSAGTTTSPSSTLRLPDLSSFPSAATTGVPVGTALEPYRGPCRITTAGTVIDSKDISCDLIIEAAEVQITRSKITGLVATDENSTGFSFSISDSEVDAGNRIATGIGSVDFTATRVHVYGGNRSIHCYRDCTVEDSYVHGQFTDDTGVAHESGIRMGQRAIIRHNTILCDAPNVPTDAGCSANLTGYGDFAPVRDNVIENNLFPYSTGGFCAYGGSSGGKEFSDDAENIVFRSNVFVRGSVDGSAGCAWWGPITDFDPSRPGNVWEANVWDDGSPITVGQ